MNEESLLILPPSFPPRQAKDLVIDWLKANPVAPSDVASAAFDPVETVLVPVHFVKITGSASFDGVVKYTRTVTNVMVEEGYTDEPNEFSIYERDDEGNNMLVGFGKRVNGQVHCSIQDRAVTLLSDLAPAPDYDLSRSRPASADELSLPRLRPTSARLSGMSAFAN